MLNATVLFFLLLLSQTPDPVEQFTINGFDFVVEKTVVDNEWNTQDTLKKLYLKEDSSKVYLLKFYTYKDNGADCNNVFWQKESYEIRENQIIFNTRYYQKTGIDPIPEKRKQIYQVTSEGKLILVYDKYKYAYSEEWRDE